MSGKTVAVTGGSGYVGAHVVSQLLEKGYAVRATVRSKPHEDDFLSTRVARGDALTIVPGCDLSIPGSFDDAFQGCDAVFHVASPFGINKSSLSGTERFVTPAVQGTVNVLTSCAKSASVKRVILTSSMAAIVGPVKNGHTYSERDWNESSNAENDPYGYSKVAAEKRAWRFMLQTKPSFDLVVVNPGLVVGPTLTGRSNEGSIEFAKRLCGGKMPFDVNLNMRFVDVRDVAAVHVACLETKTASGRYLTVSRCAFVPEAVEICKTSKHAKKLKFPKFTMPKPVVVLFGWAFAGMSPQKAHTLIGASFGVDNMKVRQQLKIEFRSLETSLLDMIDDLVEWKILGNEEGRPEKNPS